MDMNNLSSITLYGELVEPLPGNFLSREFLKQGLLSIWGKTERQLFSGSKGLQTTGFLAFLKGMKMPRKVVQMDSLDFGEIYAFTKD